MILSDKEVQAGMASMLGAALEAWHTYPDADLPPALMVGVAGDARVIVQSVADDHLIADQLLTAAAALTELAEGLAVPDDAEGLDTDD